MVFAGPDGDALPLRDAMRRAELGAELHTAEVLGRGRTRDVVIPAYGTPLQGAGLRAQLRKWVTDGQIEPSAADAVVAVLDAPGKYLDLSDRVFVVMGAGAAMGPFETLLGLGATVVACDIPVPAIWQRLIEGAVIIMAVAVDTWTKNRRA